MIVQMVIQSDNRRLKSFVATHLDGEEDDVALFQNVAVIVRRVRIQLKQIS
jgi:hypothetical protein